MGQADREEDEEDEDEDEDDDDEEEMVLTCRAPPVRQAGLAPLPRLNEHCAPKAHYGAVDDDARVVLQGTVLVSGQTVVETTGQTVVETGKQ